MLNLRMKISEHFWLCINLQQINEAAAAAKEIKDIEN